MQPLAGYLPYESRPTVHGLAGQARLVPGAEVAEAVDEALAGGRLARLLERGHRQVTRDVSRVDPVVGHAADPRLLEVGLELLGRLVADLHRLVGLEQHRVRPHDGRGGRVEQVLPVPGRHEDRLELDAVLLEPLEDGEVGRRHQREVGGVGARVLDAEDDGPDVGATEVDGGVGVDRLEPLRRPGVVLGGLGRGGRRRRGAVGDRGALLGAELLHDLGGVVVAEAVERRRVAQRRQHGLVALLRRSTCRRSHPRPSARPGVEQVPVGEERERRVVDHREHVAVLHEVLRPGQVRARRLVVDVLDLDLAAVDAARGVGAVDAGLARLARVLERRTGGAGLGEDVAELDRLGAHAGIGARLRTDSRGGQPDHGDRGDGGSCDGAECAPAPMVHCPTPQSTRAPERLGSCFSGRNVSRFAHELGARPVTRRGEPANRLPSHDDLGRVRVLRSLAVPSW